MRNRFAFLAAVAVGLLTPPCAAIAYGLVASPSGESPAATRLQPHAHGAAASTRGMGTAEVRELRGAFQPDKSNMDLGAVRTFAEFPLYALGDAFEGFRLRRVDHFARTQASPGEESLPLPEYVRFIYGACEPQPCGLPLEVQVWPACVRNLSSYSFDPKKVIPIPHVREQLRGVPAAFFAEGRLELYTGRVTVVMFSSDEERLYRAAHSLRGMNRAIDQSDRLPPPAAGAVEGKLACS
jgi:hypothetical protein